jgi:hypothetical protein
LKSKGYCGANVQDSTLVHNPPELSEDDTEKKKPAELKIVDVDVNDGFIEELQAHTNTCKHVMHRASQAKMVFHMKEHRKCKFCKLVIHPIPGKDANPLTRKRGPKTSELNIISLLLF